MTAYARAGSASSGFVAWFAEKAERRSVARVLLYLLVSRAVLWIVGYLAVRHGHPLLHPRAFNDFGNDPKIVGWLRWDVWWYVSIVEHGYSYAPGFASNVAFLPGFPLLIGAFRRVFGSAVTAGLWVANASFVAAVFALWSWVRQRGGLRAAERAVLWLLLYPASFFLNTVYAEGLFFLLCTLALRAADEGRWRSAGVCGALASLTRPLGILLAPAFAVEVFRAWRSGRPLWGPASGAASPILGLSVYAVYLWAKLGAPWASFAAQSAGWHVALTWPPIHVPQGNDAFVETLFAFEVVLVVLLAALCVRVWRRLGLVPAVYAVLASGVGLLFGGDSLAREALAVVPAFAVLGITSFRPNDALVLRICGFALLVTFACGFAMGFSMG